MFRLYIIKSIQAFVMCFTFVMFFVASGHSAENMKLADTLVNRASERFEKGDFQEAIRLTRKAVDVVVSIKGSNSLDTAAYLNLLAVYLAASDELQEAERASRKALKIREKTLGQNDPETIMSHVSLGQILRIKGDYSSAEESLRKALSAQRKQKRKADDGLGLILKELGYVLVEQASYLEAQEHLEEALSVFEKIKDRPGQISALSGLVYVFSQKGDRGGAIATSRKQLVIEEKAYGGNDYRLSDSLSDLGVLLTENGDFGEAEPLLRRALTMREKVLGPDHTETAVSLNNLAALLNDKGDYNSAEPLYRRALAIREMNLGPDHPETASSLNNLASLLYTKGDYNGAEPLFRRALAINESARGPHHPNTATSLNNLASLLMAKGDFADAEPLYRRALVIKEKALGPDHPDTAGGLNSLAALLLKMNVLSEALDHSRRAAAGGYPSRDSYLGALQASDARSPQLRDESFSVVQSTSSSEAGSALASLSARFRSGNSSLAKLVREEQDTDAQQSALDNLFLIEIGRPSQERNPKREEALKAQIAEVKLRLAEIRDQLASDFPDYAELKKPTPLKLEEVQKLLREDEALIIIDTVNDGKEKEAGGDYVWAVTTSDADWQKLKTLKGEIDKLVAELLPRLNLDNQSEIDPTLSHRLYQLTLGGFESQLFGKKHLIFVLNGAMTSLPPHVLVTRDPTGKAFRDVNWLIKDYAVTVLPTVSSLKLLRGSPAGPTAAKPMRGYADVAYAPKGKVGDLEVASRSVGELFVGGVANTLALQGASPLPATGPEARAVMQVLGGEESDIITGRKASEKEIKRAKLSDYRVLYFATHGLLAGEVEELAKVKAEPALLFAVPESPTPEDDGLLTASEVAQLKLNADWAVLSACNTAAGGKPGAAALSGLARAFFFAGARSLLVSHWPVEDEATKALMVRLFERVKAKPGMRAAEAQQAAMLSVMNDLDHPQWANPAYWAPFILVGEPR